MDGDLTSGWISAGMPSETNVPVLEVSFERKVAVTSITIDDSFSAGRTAKIKEYETIVPSVRSSAFLYSSLPEEGKTAIDVFGENGGVGWRAQTAPTKETPAAFYGEFRTAVSTDKIVLDNEVNDLVPVSFRLFVSDAAVPQEEKLNPAYGGWTEIFHEDENEKLQVEKTFETPASVRSVLYVLYEQENETQAACLSGLYLQRRLSEPDRAHYPVDFDLLYSLDGEEYEIVEVRNNASPVYTYEFAQKAEIKSIRYLPISEYGNNRPSVGEIILA